MGDGGKAQGTGRKEVDGGEKETGRRERGEQEEGRRRGGGGGKKEIFDRFFRQIFSTDFFDGFFRRIFSKLKSEN